MDSTSREAAQSRAEGAATTYKESTPEANVRFLPREAGKQNPAKNETVGFCFDAG